MSGISPGSPESSRITGPHAGLIVASLLVISGIGCGGDEHTEPLIVPRDAGGPASERHEHAATSRIQFRDVAETIGVSFQHRNGEEAGHRTMLEFIGGGVGMFDLDNDMLVDLVIGGGGDFPAEGLTQGSPSAIFRQKPTSFSFSSVARLTGIDTSHLYSHAVECADFDNDGFPDLLLTGWTGLQLWINLGDGTFLQSPVPVETANTWITSVAAGDLNSDGVLDVYATSYVDWSWSNHPKCLTPQQERDICNPRVFQPTEDHVIVSGPDGLSNAVENDFIPRTGGRGLSVLIADLDGDSFSDVYVANDMTANFLYHNNAGDSMAEIGLVSGTAFDQLAAPDGSMGLALADYNTDGHPDLWVTNYEFEQFALYQGSGHSTFNHVSEGVGLAQAVGNRVGWGTAFRDFDGDGDPDIFVTVGHPQYDAKLPRQQLPILIENVDHRRFRDVRQDAGDPYFQTPQNGRSVACGDLNNDGALDLTVSHLNNRVSVLQNICPVADFLRLRLVGTESNRDGIGATIDVETTQRKLVRHWITGGGSYLASSERPITFALLANEQLVSVRIVWPGGAKQLVNADSAQGNITMIEGRDHWYRVR
jgi:enediyne biosynthesis protein E4